VLGPASFSRRTWETLFVSRLEAWVRNVEMITYRATGHPTGGRRSSPINLALTICHRSVESGATLTSRVGVHTIFQRQGVGSLGHRFVTPCVGARTLSRTMKTR
jgi:hypothetical protein